VATGNLGIATGPHGNLECHSTTTHTHTHNPWLSALLQQGADILPPAGGPQDFQTTHESPLMT